MVFTLGDVIVICLCAYAATLVALDLIDDITNPRVAWFDGDARRCAQLEAELEERGAEK